MKKIGKMTLAELQRLNEEIYGTQNRRNYDAPQMVSRMHRYLTQVLKGVRKGKFQQSPYHLAMGFSWALALANRFEIALDDELWARFPGYCPYCRNVPCSCKTRAECRSLIEFSNYPRPSDFFGCQDMLRRIYSQNTLQDATMHLAEEVGEVDEAVGHFMGTHREDLFKEVVVELVDVITNLCAVASCLDINLAEEMEKHFNYGCPKCQLKPCQCGFTIAKAISIL